MNKSTTIDFPIIYTKMKDHNKFAVINVGRFDQWIKVDMNIILPPIEGALIPIDQITQIDSLISFQVIVNGILCSVCSLGQFINAYGLNGTWNVQYKGYFPKNMIESCKSSIIQGPVENMMKSIDIILKTKAKECNLIAYIDLDLEQIMYIVKPKSTKEAVGHIILRKTKEVGNTNENER